MTAAALALVLACTLANAKRPAAAATKTKVVEAAKPVGEPVAYDALEHHVGDEIAIETTFNTVRRGKLVKYTNPHPDDPARPRTRFDRTVGTARDDPQHQRAAGRSCPTGGRREARTR